MNFTHRVIPICAGDITFHSLRCLQHGTPNTPASRPSPRGPPESLGPSGTPVWRTESFENPPPGLRSSACCPNLRFFCRTSGARAQLQGEIFRTFLAFCGMQYLNRCFLGAHKRSQQNVGSPFMSIRYLLKTDQNTGIERIVFLQIG